MNIFVIRPKGLNVGNDAIFLGLQTLIRKHVPELPNIIVLPATTKYESSGSAGLTAKTIHDINQYGDGVIVGGGNLFENGELDLDIEALEKLAPPLMLFSLSYGRIWDRNGRLVERTDSMNGTKIAALHNAAAMSLSRDIATFDHVNSLGNFNNMLGGCPTLFLDRIRDRLPPVPKESQGMALISIRSPGLMNVSLQRQSRIQSEVRRLVDLLSIRGHENVRLLCHDPRDLAFAASFGNVPYLYQSDPYEYLALLEASEIVVSYRVHASLPCLALGTDFVNISYDQRGSSLMQTIGMESWDINMIDHEDILDPVENRLDRLADFAAVKRETDFVRRQLDETQNDEMAKFVELVSHYRASGAQRPNGAK